MKVVRFNKNQMIEGMDTYIWKQLCLGCFCLPSEKKSTLKGKNLLPRGGFEISNVKPYFLGKIKKKKKFWAQLFKASLA